MSELTPEDAKEFNLTEFKMKHNQLDGSYNTLVLSSLEFGTSFKPYPINDIEKETILWDMAENIFDGDIDKAVQLYHKPDFCFCQAPIKVPAYVIREIIRDGGAHNLQQHTEQPNKHFDRPHCQYA